MLVNVGACISLRSRDCERKEDRIVAELQSSLTNGRSAVQSYFVDVSAEILTQFRNEVREQVL